MLIRAVRHFHIIVDEFMNLGPVARLPSGGCVSDRGAAGAEGVDAGGGAGPGEGAVLPPQKFLNF